MAVKESELEKYLVQVRRIAEHREVGAEQKIRQMYKELTEDLNSWLGNCYAKYAENDMLDFAILRQKGQYARFLEETLLKVDGIYPKLKDTVEELIDTTYAVCWHGMYDGVNKSQRVADLHRVFKASRAITPEQIRAAVQNPIPKLRLKPALERNRQQIIGNIRREIGVGLSNGDRMSTMARRISGCVNNDYNKSMLIARTEAHRVREVGFNDSAERIDRIMQDNGSDYRMVKIWRNKGDKAVRNTDKANHVEMEGQTVLADEEFTLISGGKAKCPGTSGIAAEDCNCRCRASRDIMNDAEFFDATGRHFPGNIAMHPQPQPQQQTTPNKIVDDRADSIDTFTPAKTIDEAEQYAQQFIGSGYSKTFKNVVSYQGISVENANQINRALKEIYEKIDMPKINGIKVISPTSKQGKKAFPDGGNAVFSYSPVEHGIFINKNVLKSEKAFAAYREESEKAWGYVMDNIDKLSGEQKDLAYRYKAAGRSLVDDSIGGMFRHEMGHHAQWELLDAKTNNAIGSNMSKYAGKISGYAGASKGEYFAESFSAYMKGEIEKIDPEFVKFLDGKRIDKSVKRDIIRVDTVSLTYQPDTITEIVNKRGGIDRNYYGADAKQYKQISNHDHGNPTKHPFGKNGEHAHDYVYDDNGKLIDRPMRELTSEERKEAEDIL